MNNVRSQFEEVLWEPLISRDSTLRVKVFRETWVIETAWLLDPVNLEVFPVSLLKESVTRAVGGDLWKM